MPVTPVGPYAPHIRAGDWVVSSGQIGIVNGKLVDGGFVAELHQAFANLRSVLEAGGASFDQVVKTTVFLHHMSDYGVMNEIFTGEFAGHRPARSVVAVAELPLGALVEIEAWAWIGE